MIKIGKKKVVYSEQFALEFAYLQKVKGIQAIRNGADDAAKFHLKRAESILKRKQDFVALAIVGFYLGKINYNQG